MLVHGFDFAFTSYRSGDSCITDMPALPILYIRPREHKLPIIHVPSATFLFLRLHDHA